MIKSYVAGNATQLSPHFNVNEFRCKCKGLHDTKVDTDLIDKLEQLFKVLKCSKIIVNSGHRCSAHDKAVGGYGSGKHVDGMAADIVCYDKNGGIISSEIVCCAAQDIGFKGIANIDLTYTATHVDTRTNGKWYGDEAVPCGTSSSVCNDFYSHFKRTKKDVYGTDKPTVNVSIVIDGVCYSGTLTAD